MIPDNVTLVVKAPNQQIEDQNIECQTSWTVRQLKGHLSEVYPNKPKADEQKIIYSGQLLDDNSLLKDVLRQYDSEINHTMHLVCSSKNMQFPNKNTDGLRQRNVADPPRPPETRRPPETPRPEMRQNDQNHTVEMQNYFSSFVNNYGRAPPYPNYSFGEGYLPVNDPASMANHMLMMQQAYMQYMQQYANMTQPPVENPPPPAETPPQPENPEPEQDEVARDWLDNLYAASRFAILISLFCLYGSPARLLLVILIAGAVYLYQIGFFRDIQVYPLHLNRREQQNGNNERNERNELNERNEQNGREEQNERNEPQNNENQNANRPETETIDNQQSVLAVTCMIFTSFFTSLIPDTN